MIFQENELYFIVHKSSVKCMKRYSLKSKIALLKHGQLPKCKQDGLI